MPVPAIDIRQNIDWTPIQNAISAYKKQKQQEQIGNALAGAMTGGGDLQPDKIANVFKVNPQAGMQVLQLVEKRKESARALDKEAVEQMGSAAFYIERQPEETRPALYQEARNQIAAQYPDFVKRHGDKIPTDYATAAPTLRAWVARSVPVAKQMELQAQQETNAAKMPGVRTRVEEDQEIQEQWNPSTKQFEKIGSGPRWSNSPGLEVTLPDGTVVSQGKRSGTDTGLQKTTQGEVEKQLLAATEGLKNTINIQKSFDPKFATYGGQAAGAWAKLKSKVSGGESLGNDEKGYLEDFTTYRAEAGQAFSQVLKDLSGAAVNPQEMARAERFLVNPGTGVFDGDDPVTVQSKLDRMVKFQSQAIARLNYLRKHGFSVQNGPISEELAGKFPLEGMDKIIKDRYQSIYTDIKKSTPEIPEDQAVNKAKTQVAQEFGLVY